MTSLNNHNLMSKPQECWYISHDMFYTYRLHFEDCVVLMNASWILAQDIYYMQPSRCQVPRLDCKVEEAQCLRAIRNPNDKATMSWVLRKRILIKLYHIPGFLSARHWWKNQLLLFRDKTTWMHSRRHGHSHPHTYMYSLSIAYAWEWEVSVCLYLSLFLTLFSFFHKLL